MLAEIFNARITQIYLIVLLSFFTVGYLILIYNNLVRLQRNVERAWSNIDVLLKQRVDELTKLIELCKQYMQYEETTLRQLTQTRSNMHQARQKHDNQGIGQAESQARQQTKALFALAESYPDLQSNRSFQQLQQQVSHLEQSISDRREFFNASVTQYNTRRQSIPDLFMAQLGGFTAARLLDIPQEQTQDVDIAAQYRES